MDIWVHFTHFWRVRKNATYLVKYCCVLSAIASHKLCLISIHDQHVFPPSPPPPPPQLSECLSLYNDSHKFSKIIITIMIIWRNSTKVFDFQDMFLQTYAIWQNIKFIQWHNFLHITFTYQKNMTVLLTLLSSAPPQWIRLLSSGSEVFKYACKNHR